MSELALALVAGVGFGVFFQKGRLCYASALSDFFLFRSSRVGGGILLATLLTTLSWSGAYLLGGKAGFWLPSWGFSGLIGGAIFGVGMILAGACLTSTLWRVASGSGQYALVLVGILVGFFLTGLAHPWLAEFYFTPLWLGTGGTAFAAPVPAPLVAVAFVGVVVLAYAGVAGSTTRRFDGSIDEDEGRIDGFRESVRVGLAGLVAGARQYVGARASGIDLGRALRRPWDPRTCGIGIALTATLWIGVSSVWTVSGPLEDWVAFGFVAISTDLLETVPGFDAAYSGSISPGMGVIAGFLLGAFLAALAGGDFEFTPPSRSAGVTPVAGGVLMGVGATLAPGCNVTNLYTGVASLSIHGIVAGTGIVLGAYASTRLLFRARG
ncbi:YeeE/YedE thiosulfate transporter family protein [Halorhabdus sp. BNX81]|uniref:YeeE/YedE thiosulfate transporter family protein n=1 Tax=Halorhabdus sp. BNX81 TaxID=2980181 RepID=UPI0023DD3D10|nr:YeeE/YedE thiosulfate transporter family protein [Halorhabdus sp. BNX81]WEL20982.1 Putative transporter component, contains two sulfur transport domains [Halorhabdus sp. BNX81]